MLSRIVAMSCAWALLAACSPAFAQKGKGSTSTTPKGTPVKISGKVEQVAPQGLIVALKDGKKYAIGFNQTSKVGLIGKASIDVIDPGAFVQATVDLDGDMKQTKPVSILQVTEQSAINEPGIFAEAGPDAKAGQPGKYFVRGLVKMNKGDSMTIQAGQKTVTIKLSDKMTVPVTLANWQLAQAGDDVSGDGEAFTNMAQAGGPVPVLGTRIEIKTAKLITGKKGK